MRAGIPLLPECLWNGQALEKELKAAQADSPKQCGKKAAIT